MEILCCEFFHWFWIKSKLVSRHSSQISESSTNLESNSVQRKLSRIQSCNIHAPSCLKTVVRCLAYCWILYGAPSIGPKSRRRKLRLQIHHKPACGEFKLSLSICVDHVKILVHNIVNDSDCFNIYFIDEHRLQITENCIKIWRIVAV